MSRGADLARGNLDAYFRSTKPNEPWTIKPGTRVGYARRFLKSIGCGPTDEMWFRRGTAIGQRGAIVRVRWDDEQDCFREINYAQHANFWGRPCSYTNSANLAAVGPNTRFCD